MYHYASIEGAQHGPKGLDGFLDFAKKSGAAGCQPSNFMLEDGNGSFKSAASILDSFNRVGDDDDRGLRLDGVSMHCPFWVHTTAWTGSKTIRPFIPSKIAQGSPAAIEQWSEDYILGMFDLLAELGVKVVPMFWGVAFGWELATGYPWGLWKGADYDLVSEGKERFVTKTEKIRNHARKLGIIIAHEIHPGTAAMSSSDFHMLVGSCDGDSCLGVNIDPSHCWEGESWERRILAVGERIYACHVKNHVVRPGFPLRCMQPDWKYRAMQFTDLPSGDINLVRFVELLQQVGYMERYCNLVKRDSAPLVTEAESAHRDLDSTARNAIRYTRNNLCFDFATGSFEKGIGAEK